MWKRIFPGEKLFLLHNVEAMHNFLFLFFLKENCIQNFFLHSLKQNLLFILFLRKIVSIENINLLVTPFNNAQFFSGSLLINGPKQTAEMLIGVSVKISKVMGFYFY